MSFIPLWLFWIFSFINDIFNFTTISGRQFLNISIFIFILCAAHIIDSIKTDLKELSDKIDALDDAIN